MDFRLLDGCELGPFVFGPVLGHGGMAVVFRGTHRPSGTPVALKVITHEMAVNTWFRQAFRQEIRAVAGLSHPNIVMALDRLEITEAIESVTQGDWSTGTPVLVMELASGGALDAVVEQANSWANLREWLLSLLDALGHAHARGVLHRDVKPSNILLAGPSDVRVGIKLTDFGIACWRQDIDQGVLADEVTGTPLYMAPEQLLGRWRDQGPWTDLYALGCVAYELAAGVSPFVELMYVQDVRRHLFRRVAPLPDGLDVPSGFEDWLGQMMDPVATARFQSAADAAGALRALESEATVLSWPDWREGETTVLTPAPLVGAGLGLYPWRCHPLVGRTAGRDQLWDSFAQTVESGRPRATVLWGASGVGKTAMLEWFAEAVDRVGFGQSVFLACVNGGDPNAGVQDWLRQLFSCGGLSVRATRQRIRDRLEFWNAASDEVWEDGLIELLLPGNQEETGMQPLRMTDVVGVMRSVFRVVTRTRPLVVVVDDAEWAEGALSVIETVMGVQTVDPAPVYFVLAVNQGVMSELPDQRKRFERLIADGSADELTLPPLPLALHDELVRKLLRLEGDLAERVAERTQGNPKFAVQLVGAWVERGVLRHEGAGFVVAQGQHAELPERLRDLWTGRLEPVLSAAGPWSGWVMERAAVLGDRVLRSDWMEVIGTEPETEPPTETQLRHLEEELARRFLIAWTPQGWRFGQSMVRETLLASALEAGRLQGHHQACATVFSMRSMSGGFDRVRVGRHCVHGDTPEWGISLIRTGVERMGRTGHLEQGLASLDDLESAMEAAGVDEADERWCWCMVKRAGIHRLRGRNQAAEEAATLALNMAEARGLAVERAMALRELGFLTLMGYGQGDAGVLLREASSVLESHQRTREWAHCLSALSTLERNAGNLDAAARCIAQARRLFEEKKDGVGVGNCLRDDAMLNLVQGNTEEATAGLKAALAQYRSARFSIGMAQCLNNLGEVSRRCGQLADAVDHYQQAVSILESDVGQVAVAARLNLALVAVERSQWSDAATWVRPVGEHIESWGNPELSSLVSALLLPFAMTRGDSAAWDGYVSHVELLVEQSSSLSADITVALTHAQKVANQVGDRRRAERLGRLLGEKD